MTNLVLGSEISLRNVGQIIFNIVALLFIIILGSLVIGKTIIIDFLGKINF